MSSGKHLKEDCFHWLMISYIVDFRLLKVTVLGGLMN